MLIRAARTAKGLYADNIYFDVAGNDRFAQERADPGRIRMDDPRVGVDHVLLGSDFPSIHSRGDTPLRSRNSISDSGKRRNSLIKMPANYVRQKSP